MSATNRGGKRIESDRYMTPESVIHNFITKYDLDMNGLTILEPSAGKGHFCKVIKKLYPNSYIVANEINTEDHDELVKYANEIYHYDFLKMEHLLEYDVIIGNPPFSLSIEFVKKCLEISSKHTKIIMLLRTAFLESKTRYAFWQKHPLNGLYTLSSRPSFTEDGRSDATSYSYFEWLVDSDKQTIKVI